MSEVVRELIKRSVNLPEILDYYTHRFTCGNCGCRQQAYVLKGRSLKELGSDCEGCGCYVRFTTFSPDWSDK